MYSLFIIKPYLIQCYEMRHHN